ncbi:MAG: fasciclin domain-containing protein [Nonlabens sp.]
MKITHTILLTFFLILGTNIQAQSYSSSKKGDIVDIASKVDDLSTLVAAVKAADLVKTLKSDGPFTVFAPVNEAFEALPEGTVETLLKPENKKMLQSILTYHVVSGKFNATDVISAIKKNDGSFKITTVQGGVLYAMIKDGNVVLKDEKGGMSTVIKTDVSTSNGVVHLLDTVVMPE